MAQTNSNPRLGGKQIIAIKNFFSKLEKYEVKTSQEEICIRMFNKSGEVTLFEDEAKAYQPYAIQVIKRLTKRNIFYVKEAVNPETGRKVKVICLNKENPVVQDFQG